MIKGTYFLRLLKLLSYTLLISFSIGFVNFSSAVQYQQNIGYNYIEPFSINISGFGDVDYSISSKGTFSSSINGKSYNFLYFRGGSSTYETYLVLGWKNGQLYGFVKTNNPSNSQYRNELQGYFDKFAIVQSGYNFSYDNSHMYSLSLSWDTAFDYLNSNSIIGFHGSNGNDYANVNYANGNFMRFAQSYFSDWCFITNNVEYPYLCFFHSSLDGNGVNSNLTGNLLEIIPDWDSLESWNGFYTSSPLGGGGNGGGSINININNNITGDYVSSNCTYQQIFDYAESNGYSSYLCYGGLNNFDLYNSSGFYNPIAGTGKTLGQILSYSNAWDTPQEWFTFWNGLYLDRYNHTYDAMWESYPAVYRTWFDLYYRYGGQLLIFDSVREYCAIKMLDIDFNTTYYKGQYFKNTCDYIQNGGHYPYGDNSTGDSDNVVGVNWVGVGNMGSGVDSVKISDNPAVFIQDFFNQLKANLPTRYDLGGGFLPVYIITFLCAIILFRFISH